MLNVNIKESDWPEWANYAAKNSDQRIVYFELQPYQNSEKGHWSVNSGRYEYGKKLEGHGKFWTLTLTSRHVTDTSDKQVTSLSVLQEVSRIQEQRGAIYEGREQERSMAKIVAIFNLHHGTELTESQGWHFMEILKNVRLFNAPEYHHDSGVDGVSYAALKVEAKAKEKR